MQKMHTGWFFSEARTYSVLSIARGIMDEPSLAAPAHAPGTVAHILAQHAEAIAAMRAALAADPLFDTATHDELWCARFLLSHKGNVKKALAAASATLALRAERGLDEVRAFVTSHGRTEWPGWKTASELAPYAIVHPDPDRGPCVCFRHALSDYHALASTTTNAYDEWMLHLRHLNEWVTAVCDAVTRRTGRLAKIVRLDDFEGFTLGKFSWKLIRRWSSRGAAEADIYPQMLGAVCAFHAPAMAERFWRALRPLLPPRVGDKFGLYDAKRPADAERFEAWIARSHLPEWLGGESGVTWPPPDATVALASGAG